MGYYHTLSSGLDLLGGATLGLLNFARANGSRQIKEGTLYDAQFAIDASLSLSKFAGTIIEADGGRAFAANQSMGGFRLTSLGEPVSVGDATSKSYVDRVAVGLRDFKESVRVATTSPIENLSGASVLIDGVVLVEGDRVLVKDGASVDGVESVSGARNGIYRVGTVDLGVAALVRTADADDSVEVTSGMYTYVSEGDVNLCSLWVLTTVGPIVLGTTSLVFVHYDSARVVPGAGLERSGDILNVVAAAGGAIIVSEDGVGVSVDDSSVAVVANNLVVKDGGITETKLAPSVVGDGLSGGGGLPLSLRLGDGLEVVSGDARVKVGGGTLFVGPSGLRLANLPENHLLVGNSSSVPTIRQRVIREIPVGDIDGVNTTFALSKSPVNSSERVYLNGVLRDVGVGSDYTISGNIITYNSPPLVGSRLRVSYIG